MGYLDNNRVDTSMLICRVAEKVVCVVYQQNYGLALLEFQKHFYTLVDQAQSNKNVLASDLFKLHFKVQNYLVLFTKLCILKW